MKPFLVVWETHHLGDALLSLPFLRAARMHRELRVICRLNQAPLYRAFDPALHLMVWEPFWAEDLSLTERILSFFKLGGMLWKLRRLGGHEAVSCWADVRIHLLMLAAGATKRAGLPMVEGNFYAAHLKWRRRKLEKAAAIERQAEKLLGGKLLSDPVFREAADPSHLGVWKQMGIIWGWTADCSTPWLIAGPLKNEALRTFLETARAEQREIWMVHPGARHPARRWPVAFFRETLRKVLDGRNAAVIFVESGEEILEAELSAGEISIQPESLEDFIAAVQGVDVLFCNDSFPAHLGAALGKKVWTIFSNQDPGIFAPFQNEARVISRDVCEFRPCLDHCVKPSFECLEAVTIADAIKKLKS